MSERLPFATLRPGEIVVDCFAGGGGTSEGIKLALGRDPDIAINHNPLALAMHRANHPRTRHYPSNIRAIDPVKVCAGRPVGLAWFSPDCTFHSIARGGKPFRDRDLANRIRGLAWVVIDWAKAVRPRIIMLENVREFQNWGPLTDHGKPCPLRKGFTFRRWRAQLENLGYQVDLRELSACDYGAPTTRKRLFVVARCDGQPIVWPEPTHGPGCTPYRTAAECIDWSIPTYSIFLTPEEAKRYGVRRPLADNTLRRIARGIQKYVIDDPEPFIVCCNHGGDWFRGRSTRQPMPTLTTSRDAYGLIVPTLIQCGYGERKGQAPRVPGMGKPLGIVVAGGRKHALVAAFLAKHYGGHETPGSALHKPSDTITARDHQALVASHLVKLKGTSRHGQRLTEPLHTIGAQGNHYAEVRALLIKFYSEGGQWGRLQDPMPTIPTRDRIGLVTVAGEDYAIADIGMRMLTPRELFRAMGFPDSYTIDPVVTRIVRGKKKRGPLPAELQTEMCGNAVSPYHAAAMVRSQCEERAEEAVA